MNKLKNHFDFWCKYTVILSGDNEKKKLFFDNPVQIQ